MTLSKILRNIFLVITACLVLSACATKKVSDVGSQMQGDVYTGTDTVEYLASGVPDRVFFATNESILTTRSRDTLRKQAAKQTGKDEYPPIPMTILGFSLIIMAKE